MPPFAYLLLRKYLMQINDLLQVFFHGIFFLFCLSILKLHNNLNIFSDTESFTNYFCFIWRKKQYKAKHFFLICIPRFFETLAGVHAICCCRRFSFRFRSSFFAVLNIINKSAIAQEIYIKRTILCYYV